MSTAVLDTFPPLHGAIAQAESWTHYLKARRPEEVVASLESIVAVGINLGEMLPLTWRLTFTDLLRSGTETWSTVREFEAIRQSVARLFFTAREALDWTRQVAEALQSLTGRKPVGMDRLLCVMAEAGQLQEAVFRDWPSFAEPLPPGNYAESLPVEDALAEALGISVEEARQRIDARRHPHGCE